MKKLILFITLLFSQKVLFSAVTVTSPTLNINTCYFASNFYHLNTISIDENINTDISMPVVNTFYTLILSAPANFNFQVGSATVSFQAGGDITEANVVSVTSTQITVRYRSSQANRANNDDRITIAGSMVCGITGASTATILRTAASPGTGTITGITNNVSVFANLQSTIIPCNSPGGVLNGLETWSKASDNFSNDFVDGRQTILNGIPAVLTSPTMYNYNWYANMSAPTPVFVSGGANPNRQFVKHTPNLLVNSGFLLNGTGWDYYGNYTEAYAFETSYGGPSATNLVAEIDAGADGVSNNGDDMQLSRLITGLVIGTNYELCFDFSRRNVAPNPMTINVAVVGVSPTNNVTATNVAWLWQNQCITFTATASEHIIQFIPVTGGSGSGMIIDNVTLISSEAMDNVDYSSLFWSANLTDLTRASTHIATCGGVTSYLPSLGTLHGSGGAFASIQEALYEPDFESVNVWNRNGTVLPYNSLHTNTKQILSAVTPTNQVTSINRFFGGQNDNFDGSFLGHSRDWLGFAAEVIGYKSSVSLVDRSKIHTYLAVKYGVTLSQNYIATNGGTIYTVIAPYTNNIIGIGRDDIEELNQKQSHYDNDLVRIYRGTVAVNNASNTSLFTNDISYVVIGDNNGAHCSTAAANIEIPTGLTNCTLYSRLEKEWKVQRTNMDQTFNMDVTLAACAFPGLVNVNDLRLLVDNDGNFSNGGTQCYYIGDGSGINFTYTNPMVSITGISTTHIPNNSARFITIASVNVLTPLPVELLSFNAKLASDKRTIDVYWKTEYEINTDYFTLQKLINNEWLVLEIVNATGTVTNGSNYEIVDEFPIFGDNIYRLMIVDEDGNFKYSDARVVSLDPSENFIQAFPNPASANINLVLKNIAKNEIQIFDATGRTIDCPFLINNDDNLIISTVDLSSGIYTIRVIGEKNLSVRIMVQN